MRGAGGNLRPYRNRGVPMPRLHWSRDLPQPRFHEATDRTRPVVYGWCVDAHTRRAQARLQARQVLCQALLARGCAPAPGLLRTGESARPPWPPRQPGVGLSISHARGASAVGLLQGGMLGIDILHLDEVDASLAEMHRLALDHCGPAAAKGIDSRAKFARAWCRLEAQLKLFGLTVTEWTPALGEQLRRCTTADLHPPAPWVGAVAWHAG